MKRRFRFYLVSFLAGCDLFLYRLGQRLSSILGSSIIIFSKPDDLEALVKAVYSREDAVKGWGGEDVRTRGLYEGEARFVKNYLKGKKSCLVFQCGGGRESLALAKLGFEVTGVDSSAPLIEKAKAHASHLGVSCRFEIGDILDSYPSAKKFDALFLTQGMYSAIPMRARRVAFLKKALALLEGDGFFYIEFRCEDSIRKNGWKFKVKKWLASFFCGYRALEPGDVVLRGGHFFHLFDQIPELVSEFEEGGFKAIETDVTNRYAILAPRRSSG